MTLLLLLPLAGCAPDYEDADVKFVGVGYDPTEIGPSPEPAGGVVEYSLVNFAGAGLSLALMQLGAFGEVGPDMAGFAPPYSAVYAFSYVFSHPLAAADSLGGVTSVPPEVEDTCYTAFSPTGPIGSFDAVDVGNYMEIVTADGSGGVRLDRSPRDYPADPQDVFTYYSGIDLYRDAPVYGLVPGDSTDPSDMQKTLVAPASYPAGEAVYFRFPGGFAPDTAPIASIPQPSEAAGVTSFRLPHKPGGVMLSWNGPTYDNWGGLASESGEVDACLAWRAGGTTPSAPGDCDAADGESGEGVGQMYTGPWDTTDGQVTLRWTPRDDADEVVSVSVRFLGPVDMDDENFKEEVVLVPPAAKANGAWAQAQKQGLVPGDVSCPDGRRAPTACEAAGAWEFDDAYLTADGDLVPSMRGDPFNNVAELTCRMKDDGEFTVTNAMLESAITYARAHGAQGAVFYFARGVEVDAAVPDVRDRYDQRHVITPIKIASRAVDIGRFWFEE